MTIDYKLIYSDRKSINIAIDKKANIIVRAPKSLQKTEIDKLVNRKKHWLINKINSSITSKSNTKEFVSGESILYLGEHYSLNISNEIFDGLSFDKNFEISSQNKHKAKKIFRDWYLSEAKRIFNPIVGNYSKSLGVKYNKLYIKSMKSSWGSCSTNYSITLNWKLIKAPIYVIEYVIAHELAHLIELNHSENFWNIISVQIPNFKKATKWLTEHGELLEMEL